MFQAGVPWLMAFQQRVSAGFSLWRKETTVGGEEGRCSLVEVELQTFQRALPLSIIINGRDNSYSNFLKAH